MRLILESTFGDDLLAVRYSEKHFGISALLQSKILSILSMVANVRIFQPPTIKVSRSPFEG